MEEEIDKIVCTYFGIGKDDLYSKSQIGKICDARFFTWYILHYKFNKSIKFLSDRYNRSYGHVKKGVAKIKNGILYQPFFKTKYADLMYIIEKSPTK